MNEDLTPDVLDSTNPINPINSMNPMNSVLNNRSAWSQNTLMRGTNPKNEGLTPDFRVWTIQPVGVLAQLREDRVLHTDPGCIPKEFHHAYDWMRAQMGQRLAYYDGHYPWWAWHTPRPDLRQSAHLPHGTQGVRLQLQIDPTEVLLSDFDAWHSVLNRDYLALNVEEDEAWYQRSEATILNQRPWPPPEPWYSGILTSWERVFDLEALATSEYWQPGPRYIQATFETLRLANVRQATRFVAR